MQSQLLGAAVAELPTLDMNRFVESQHAFKRSNRVAPRLISIASALLLIFSNEAHAKNAYRPEAGICGSAVRGDVRRVRAFLEKDRALIHERDHGATVLHWAVRPGNVEVVKLLLDEGAEVDARASDVSTPLHWAASHGEAEVVKLLLGQRASVEVTNNRGETPLLFACSYNHKEELVRLLLDAGADASLAAGGEGTRTA